MSAFDNRIGYWDGGLPPDYWDPPEPEPEDEPDDDDDDVDREEI